RTCFRRERRRRQNQSPHSIAARFQIGHNALKVVDVAQHRNAANRLPPIGHRRREDANRPDLLYCAAFNSTQEYFWVGSATEKQCGSRVCNFYALECSRIVEVTVDDPQATQEKHLQEPVKQNGDLAEKERAVKIPRHQNVIECEQRDSKYGRRLKQVV